MQSRLARSTWVVLLVLVSTSSAFALAPTTVIAVTPATTGVDVSVAHTDVMQGATNTSSGTTGNHTYRGFRIPGFLSFRGRLLVFAEGRTNSCADYGQHDLVLRVHDGQSWGSLRVLLDPGAYFADCNRTEAMQCKDGTGPGRHWDSPGCQTGKGNICGGGCAVWDPTPVGDVQTGEIHVFFGRSTSSCKGGTNGGLREDLWVMTSSDLGDTWAAPRNVTAACSAPFGGGVTPSGGHGIQLQGTPAEGHLVVPLYVIGNHLLV